MNAFEYYDWLFFNATNRRLTEWIEKKKIDIGTQSISDYFSICLQLVKQKPLVRDKLLCFKKEMWKLGKERLAIGLRIELEDTTPHMINILNEDTFIGDDDEEIPYHRINRVVTIPTEPKFSQDNIKVGMQVVMVNKRKTGNVYTVTNTEENGFDARNGEYELKMLEYASIDHIVKPPKARKSAKPADKQTYIEYMEEEGKEISRQKEMENYEITDEQIEEERAHKQMEDDETNVVCVKVAHIKPKYKNLKEWMADPQNVYIGRRGIVFVNKVRFPPKNSKFANPFKIGGKLGRSKEKMTRDDVLRLYKAHLEEEIRLGKITKEEILALKGKTLGCWCENGDPCHGDIIVAMIKELSD